MQRKDFLTLRLLLIAAFSIAPLLWSARDDNSLEPNEAYELLLKHPDNHVSSPVAPHISRKELEHEDVCRKLDNTTTSFGRWGLEQYLIQPQDDIATITAFQNGLYALCHDEQAIERLQRILEDIAESETYILSYFESTDELKEEIAHDLYFDKLLSYEPGLNESTLALEAGIHGRPIGEASIYLLCLLWPSIYSQFSHIIPSLNEIPQAIKNGLSIYGKSRAPWRVTLSGNRYEEMCTYYNNSRNRVTDMGATYAQGFVNYIGNGARNAAREFEAYDVMNDIDQTLQQTSQALRNPMQDACTIYNGGQPQGTSATPVAQPTTPSLKDAFDAHRVWGCNILQAGIRSCSSCIWDALWMFLVYRQYEDIKRRYASVHQLHTVLYHISSILENTREMHRILSEYVPQDALDRLPSSSFVNGNEFTSDKLNQLNERLCSETFTKDAYLYSRGKVLATHHIMKNNTDAFIPLLQYIGAADALVGIADLYNDLRSEQNGFCFATFDPSASTPYVHFENFWTPLLPADKAVGNTATLDTQNAIFTGPNGIGKSTNMKGIAHSIIMAQSIGIVPADSAHMSLFNYIGTYLNIREDIQAGLSSFMAEKKRVDEFYKEAPHLTGNVLYLLDEPFRGTYAQEAERRVYEFGQFINQYPNIMMLMATHFEHPVHLQDQHRFINYHVGIDENDDGSFHLTYKLRNGLLWWWFYDDDKRARFIDWISDHIQ